MRRSEKAITDRGDIDAIIRECRVCRLAMAQDNVPYVVPMSFGYDGKALYFHSAPEGMKMEILRKNPRVCFEISPEPEIKSGKTACKWGMAYRSVIGFGTVTFLDDPEARRRALDILMAQYAEGEFEFPEASPERLSLFRVEISFLSGKRSA